MYPRKHCKLSAIVVGTLLGAVTLWLVVAVAAGQKDDAATYNARGLEAYKAGKYPDAINFFKQAIKLRKDYVEPYLNLGNAYVQIEEYRKAVESFKQATKFAPSSAIAFNNLGLAYYKLNDYRKAIEAYDNAIRLDPKFATAYYNLGVAYVDDAKNESAIQQYKVLKTIDPQLARKLYLEIYKPAATVFGATTGIRLTVGVVDPQGAPVTGLSREDFHVLDESLPQSITSFSDANASLVYALAVDASGSMRAALPQELRLSKAIVQRNEAADETSLIQFVSSDKIETVQEFSSDKNVLNNQLDLVYIEGGQSAILDAVYLAAQSVARYKSEDGIYRRRAVILLTDGEDRASYYNLESLIKLLNRVDVQVFAICMNHGPDGESGLNRNVPKGVKEFLTLLGSETGGWAFFPKNNSELDAVASQLTDILRHEYVLNYKPSSPILAGTYRRVNVNVSSSRLGPVKPAIIVRSGYVVPEPPPAP
jgi:Ca-activated chloride channel family protein